MANTYNVESFPPQQVKFEFDRIYLKRHGLSDWQVVESNQNWTSEKDRFNHFIKIGYFKEPLN